MAGGVSGQPENPPGYATVAEDRAKRFEHVDLTIEANAGLRSWRERERERHYIYCRCLQTVTLAIGYYNRHIHYIHSGDG